jgi:hypothetical protein
MGECKLPVFPREVARPHTPPGPEQSVFDIDRKRVRDLAPEEEALAVIRAWYNPPIVVGMVCGDDMYGPIKMIAHGDDIQPRTKLFHFNPERTPMIWEFSQREEREAAELRYNS